MNIKSIVNLIKENSKLETQNKNLNEEKLELYNKLSIYNNIDMLLEKIERLKKEKSCILIVSIFIEIFFCAFIVLFSNLKNFMPIDVINTMNLILCGSIAFCTVSTVKFIKNQSKSINSLKKQARTELDKVKACDKTDEQIIEIINKINSKVVKNENIIYENNKKMDNIKREIFNQFVKNNTNIKTLKENIKVKKLTKGR